MSKINWILSDNMEFMAKQPDKKYPLAIVDPPYGINAPNMQLGHSPNRYRDGHGSGPSVSTAVKLKKGRLSTGGGALKNSSMVKFGTQWDFCPPPPEYFKELFRVSQNQIIWGGNYFDLPPTRCVLCWDKLQSWENFSQWEMAWTSFDKPAALYRLSNTGGANDKAKIHPTQKPEKLYRWLLTKFAKPGDLILDTHGGSGTIALACHKMGFDLDIVERDEIYMTAAVDRFKHYTKQQQINF